MEADSSKAFAHVRIEAVAEHLPFARLEGAELQNVEESDRAYLRNLMSKHGVLVFSGQNLTPAQELAVNHCFGYHDPEEAFGGRTFGFTVTSGVPVYAIPSCPAVQVQGNGTFLGHCGIEEMNLEVVVSFSTEGFHSDGLHDQTDFDSNTLPVLTSMYCHQACTEGGETNFICSRAPLAKLEPEELESLRHCHVHYQSRQTLSTGRPIMKDGLRRLRRKGSPEDSSDGGSREAWLATAQNGPVHPLIRKHAETGEEAVCVSCGNVAFMVCGDILLGPSDSYALIERFFARQPIYAHRWHPGDFVIWDNRLCLHAGPRKLEGDRLIHRVRLRGAKDSWLSVAPRHFGAC